MAIISKFMNDYTFRRNAIIVASSMVVTYWSTLKLMKARSKKLAKQQKSDVSLNLKHMEKSEKVAVDKRFFHKLLKLVKIIVPSWFCPEVGYLLLVSCSLIARTFCDVFLIHNGTLIESSIISGNTDLFVTYVSKYVYAMPFISLVNNILKYGLDELKLRFRTRLTKHLYQKYLGNLTYYKMSNLDSRIANADQLLTQDVEKFCNSLTELYSNLSKVTYTYIYIYIESIYILLLLSLFIILSFVFSLFLTFSFTLSN